MSVHGVVRRQGALPVDKHTVLNYGPIVWHLRCPLRQAWDGAIQIIALHKRRDQMVVGDVDQARHAKSDVIPDICRICAADKVQLIVRDLETQSHLIHDVAESHECILVRLKRAAKKNVPARRQELDVPAQGTHRRRHGGTRHPGWLDKTKGAMAAFEGSEKTATSRCQITISRPCLPLFGVVLRI